MPSLHLCLLQPSLLSLFNDRLIASFEIALAQLVGFARPPTYIGLFLLLAIDDGLILGLSCNLKSIRVNLQLFDVIDWRHVLLVILLIVLLLSKLTDLEHLKPAFVSKHLGAELNHLAVNCVIGRYVIN